MRPCKRSPSIDWNVLNMQSQICKSFANPTRLYILHLLGEREWAVTDLRKKLGVSVPNLSQHLSILKAVGIVTTRREGKRLYCSLRIPEVKQACELIHDVLRRQIRDIRKLVA